MFWSWLRPVGLVLLSQCTLACVNSRFNPFVYRPGFRSFCLHAPPYILATKRFRTDLKPAIINTTHLIDNNTSPWFPVWNPGEFCCQSHGDFVSVESNNGFIASAVTEETGCGKSNCPWRLTAQYGQQLNISLYDFAIASSSKIILWVAKYR